LRKARLRAEHVAFSFMKRRVQSLMARDHLGYEYTGPEDTSLMPGEEIDDDAIIERLVKIFKDMPVFMPWPVLVYSATSPHYVKTSNRSCNICNGPLTPVTSTHICNGCCLAPVTYKRARTTPGLASTTPVTNVDFW
jgi:hypothetical protein